MLIVVRVVAGLLTAIATGAVRTARPITTMRNTTVIDDEWEPIGEVMPDHSCLELSITHFVAKLGALIGGNSSWPFI